MKLKYKRFIYFFCTIPIITLLAIACASKNSKNTKPFLSPIITTADQNLNPTTSPLPLKFEKPQSPTPYDRKAFDKNLNTPKSSASEPIAKPQTSDKDLLKEINVIAQKITLSYNGNKSKTSVNDIDQTKIVFNGLNKNKFNFKIISITPKLNNKTIAVIQYVITKKNDNSLLIKSNEINKEINGFFYVLSQDKLDQKINNINLSVDRDIMLKNVNNLNDLDIKPTVELKQNLELVDVIKTKKSDTTISVSFRIKQKYSTLKSKIKKLVISGFRKNPKSFIQLNNILNKITEVKYKGIKDNTEIVNLTAENFTFSKLSNVYKIAQFAAIPQSDQTTAKIILKISEIGQTIISNAKSFFISGFKKPSQTIINLDNTAKKVTATYNNLATTAFLSLANVQINQIKFTGLSELTKLQVVINPLILLNNNNTTILVYFYLQDIITKNKSNTYQIEINGFMSIEDKKEELQLIAKKVVLTYPNASEIILNSISDIKQKKIIESGYDKTKYALIIKNIAFDEEIDDDSEIDKSKVYVDFVLKEISSGIEVKQQKKLNQFKSIYF